jgi:hypothetical protein
VQSGPYCSLISTKIGMCLHILSRLTSYVDKIIGDHYCGFHCNHLITDQIFCICQRLEKMGVQWDSTLATYRLQAGVRFSS